MAKVRHKFTEENPTSREIATILKRCRQNARRPNVTIDTTWLTRLCEIAMESHRNETAAKKAMAVCKRTTKANMKLADENQLLKGARLECHPDAKMTLRYDDGRIVLTIADPLIGFEHSSHINFQERDLDAAITNVRAILIEKHHALKTAAESIRRDESRSRRKVKAKPARPAKRQ